MTKEEQIKQLVEQIASIKTGEDWREALQVGDKQRAEEIANAEKAADELKKLGSEALPYLLEKVGMDAYLVKAVLINLGEVAEEQVKLLLSHSNSTVQKEAQSILNTIEWLRNNVKGT